MKPPKDDEEWKWRKQFKEVVIEKCKFTKESILHNEIENTSPLQVFSKNVGLKALLLFTKKKSDRYGVQIRRMFQMTSEDLRMLFGINILMGINKPFKMGRYWSGLGNIST